MAKFKPYHNKYGVWDWFYMPVLKHPDQTLTEYLTGRGEFSVFSSIGFERKLAMQYRLRVR